MVTTDIKGIGIVAFALVSTLNVALAVAGSDGAKELTFNVLQMDASETRGESLYLDQCASCHGANADGAAQHDIPALAGQRRAYIVKQLADFIERDRIASQMHKVVSREAVRHPQALADVSLYLNNLPPTKSAETGDGKYLTVGEASYVRFCSSCHGDDGGGDDDGYVPSLRNQHYRYLLKEMRGLAAGHRFNVEADLTRFLNSLKQDERQGLADYISRMQVQVPQPPANER